MKKTKKVNSKSFVAYLKKHGELEYEKHDIFKKIISIIQAYNNRIKYLMSIRDLKFNGYDEERIFLLESFEGIGIKDVSFYSDMHKITAIAEYVDQTNNITKTKRVVLPLEFLDKGNAFIEKVAAENFNKRIDRFLEYREYNNKRNQEIAKLEARLKQLKEQKQS